MGELDQQECMPICHIEATASWSAQTSEPAAQSPIKEEDMIRMIDIVIARLQELGTGRDEDFCSDEELVAQLKEVMLDLASFAAGNLRRHAKAWQYLFQQCGEAKQSKVVLDWIVSGVKLDFVHPESVEQQKHPLYQVRLRLVQQLLQKTLHCDDVSEMIDRSEPAQVQFANRVSCSMHRSFVQETLQELIRVGTLQHWSGPKQPVVVNGLGVVVNRKGKPRLILDCRYVNLFLQYAHFTYEQLSDVTDYVTPDGWFVLTDAKSGYHHVPMHESSFKYLAIEFDGQLLVFTHLPFGLSKACKVYTIVMQEVYKPLRLHGQCLTFLIDDALFAAATRAQCMYRVKTVVLLLTALGFYLSWDKCTFTPVQQGKFLGLIVNSKSSEFGVPEDKSRYIQSGITAVLQQQSATPRQLASIAGMLLSIAPAVHMAPLYTRTLYQAMRSAQGWDARVDSIQLACEDLEYWQHSLAGSNSKSWVKRDKVVHMSGDASQFGYGASNRDRSIRMVQSFDEEEIALMRVGKLSSVFRETKNARLAMQCVNKSQ